MNVGVAKGKRSQENQQIMFENLIVNPVNVYASTKVVKVQLRYHLKCAFHILSRKPLGENRIVTAQSCIRHRERSCHGTEVPIGHRMRSCHDTEASTGHGEKLPWQRGFYRTPVRSCPIGYQ